LVARVDMVGTVVTALATLCAVLLGGWITSQGQRRSWSREHQREWRDIRLNAYNGFLTAYRQYVSFALEPSARIGATPHPRREGEMMPFFDKEGLAYRERLEASKTLARLVSEHRSTVDALTDLLRHARLVAASRADFDATAIPPERFDALWEAERAFVAAARIELGLRPNPPRPGGQRPPGPGSVVTGS